MSTRDTTVPKSFEAQRTKAKMVPGAKLSTRRRWSRIVSSTSRPNLIQCSIRFSSQVSSTRVRAVAASLAAGLPVCGVAVILFSIGVREFSREQLAQHAGDGLTAPESSDLDAAAQCRGDVNGEPGGEALGAIARKSRWLGLSNPCIRITGTCRKRTFRRG